MELLPQPGEGTVVPPIQPGPEPEVVLDSAALSPLPIPSAPRRPQDGREKPEFLRRPDLEDPYAWMKDRDDPDLRRYLAEEGAYAQQFLSGLSLRDELLAEMERRINHEYSTAGFDQAGFRYYERYRAGLNYPLICRQALEAEAPEEVLFDPNSLIQGDSYLKLGGWAPSPDNKFLAVACDTKGSEHFDIKIVGLGASTASDEIADVGSQFEWDPAGNGIYYLGISEQEICTTAHFHLVGQAREQDLLLYTESDPSFQLSLGKSTDERHVLLTAGSWTSEQALEIGVSGGLPFCRDLTGREDGVRSSVDIFEGVSYLCSDKGAKNFALHRRQVNEPDSNWEELRGSSPGVLNAGVCPFRGGVILHTVSKATDAFEVISDNPALRHAIVPPLDEAVREWHFDQHQEPGSKFAFFTFSSPRIPDRRYRYDLESREWTLVWEKHVPNFDCEDYESRRIFAAASDGAQIPISLMGRRDLSGAAPTLMLGYGAYGSFYEQNFEAWPPTGAALSLLALMDRGFRIAIAHVRGGAECGMEWYEDGKLSRKMNSFTDFNTCGAYLLEQGITAPGALIAEGGSAGGLLVGASILMRPDLYSAAVIRSGFLDAVNTMSDPTLPLVEAEYGEWGNPNDPEALRLMSSYSPYELAKKTAGRKLPAILVLAGFEDQLVQVHESAKFVAALRAAAGDESQASRPLIFKVDMESGHNGKRGRYNALNGFADTLAFMLSQVDAG